MRTNEKTALLGAALLAIGMLSGTVRAQSSAADQFRYRVDYKCNGERVQVAYCRRDSDMAGFPATLPEENYCLIYYPDRPKRGGFTVQTSELRSDVIKKLQACGALAEQKPMSTQPNAPSQQPPDGNAEAYFAEGEKYYQAKDYAKAIPPFREVVRRNPGHANAWGRLGLSYFVLKQYQDALAAFQQCLRLVPNNADVEYMLGLTHFGLGQKEAALEAYRKLQPLNKEEAQRLYDVINGKQETPAPAGPAKPATTAAPPDEAPNPGTPLARQYIVLGSLQENQGKTDEAKSNYLRAIELKPDADTLAMAHLYLGTLYRDQKKYVDAVSSYKESLRIRPADGHTSYLLGVCYVEMGKKDQAMEIYRAIQSSDKDDADQLLRQIQNTK
jgi:tetratricopeptide (TPR) repeat protein